jgi:hypothetical protein
MAGWGFLRTKALASHMAGFDQRVYLFEEAEMPCSSVIDNTRIYVLHVAVLIRHCMLCASAWRLLEFSSWLLHLLWVALLLDHGEWRQLLVLACCYCLNYFIARSLEDWNVHHGPGRNGCDQVHCEDSAILADHHDGDLELFWLAWGRFLSSITDSTTYSMIGL